MPAAPSRALRGGMDHQRAHELPEESLLLGTRRNPVLLSACQHLSHSSAFLGYCRSPRPLAQRLQARERGQEVWYYAGGCPYDPYPTHELLNVPAVEARAFFWVAWRMQYTGWLHWELNVWSNNMGGDKRWPEVPWDPARSGVRNGEVGRIYPGPDATPLPSIRLENMRDGIEDYDYLWLLRDKAGKLPTGSARRASIENLITEAIDALCQSRAHFERDPQKVLAVHEKLGLALEGLSR